MSPLSAEGNKKGRLDGSHKKENPAEARFLERIKFVSK
nr:MAG TPA_asm: hypothetical protein [Caudoviricetes sp.]